MEKLSLYLKKILALLLAVASYILSVHLLGATGKPELALLASVALLIFAYLDFRITGEKPRFLFGMNQSDTFLNKKGGFWNLFKWIVNFFGILYDLIVWSVWGIFLLFNLFIDALLLIKTIVYWIIYAIIWFIRQLFPPFIFLFKMFMHYIVNWSWWIYQLSVRNLKTSVNKNFYFIALWGTIPALFIIFLFYATSQVVGINGLVAISAVFAIIPLVWSFGEISALRFEKRETDTYDSVRVSFRNGFEAIRSVLFYLIIIIILLAAEIIFNLLGWIPNLSMSFLGISLNLNMAISFLLVFLAIIIVFAACILPTHILYKPEHQNDLNSSLGFLKVIGRKFLPYSFAEIPATFFGGLLLVIPVVVMLLTYTLSDQIKDSVLDVKIEKLQDKKPDMESLDAYRTGIRIQRLEKYQNLPLMAPDYFSDLRGSGEHINMLEAKQSDAREQMESRKLEYEKKLSELAAQFKQATATNAPNEKINTLSANRMDLEEEYLNWESNSTHHIAYLKEDLKEQKRIRAQMPILYFFMGILFAVFGGIVFAVFIAYIGNVYYELYNLKEDGKPSEWNKTITDIKNKNPNQPLLGFTFLVIIGGVVTVLIIQGILAF